jgi:hypothetical protein
MGCVRALFSLPWSLVAPLASCLLWGLPQSTPQGVYFLSCLWVLKAEDLFLRLVLPQDLHGRWLPASVLRRIAMTVNSQRPLHNLALIRKRTRDMASWGGSVTAAAATLSREGLHKTTSMRLRPTSLQRSGTFHAIERLRFIFVMLPAKSQVLDRLQNSSKPSPETTARFKFRFQW